MFYVPISEITRLSGRSKQSVNKRRSDGTIPADLGPQGIYLFDIDDPEIKKLILTPPKGVNAVKRTEADEYRKGFERRRVAGEVSCAMTSLVDYMAETEPAVQAAVNALAYEADDQLERFKKEKEVEKLVKTIEKLDADLKKFKGDLIDRGYVERWIQKYLSVLHRQILDFAPNGAGAEVYNIVKREDESGGAVKKVEKYMETELSKLLRDTMSTMRNNPL